MAKLKTINATLKPIVIPTTKDSAPPSRKHIHLQNAPQLTISRNNTFLTVYKSTVVIGQILTIDTEQGIRVSSV